MAVSRRLMLFGGAAAVGVGLAVPAVLNLRRPQATIEAVVRRVFGSDAGSDQTVRNFADACVKRLSGIGLGRGPVEDLVAATYPILAPVMGLAPMPSIAEPLGSPYENAESAIATLFIKYSDYAIRAPGQPAKFAGFPEVQPYMCLNLQARFDTAD